MREERADGDFAELYLQISPNILESFPKFRPPVDLYFFDADVSQVKMIHRAEARLGTEKQAQVAEYARNDQLYLLRDDYRVYAHHLSKRLGLVLVEDDLRPVEVAEIFFLAFRDRMETFLEQPKEGPLNGLIKDVSILAEYLWADPGRVDVLTRTLHKEYSLAVHSVNTMFIGLGLFVTLSRGKLEKAELVSLALGLLLHDLGMVNVPRFIVDKEQYLVRRDRESIEKHINAGVQKLKRLKVDDPIVFKCLHEHHERVDGSGYPDRLSGRQISLPGRICALSDSFSAMIGDRPYHDPKANTEAALSLVKDRKYDTALARFLAILIMDGGRIQEFFTGGDGEEG